MSFNHLEIEKKWQQYWEKNKTFKTVDNRDKPKFYVLDMFPYPRIGTPCWSPRRLHATDIIARYKRMKGFNVMRPMGWGCLWFTS